MHVILILFGCKDRHVVLPLLQEARNVLMESKGGKKKCSSSSSLQHEAPLGYTVEDIRPNGGIKKFQSAAYSNVRTKSETKMSSIWCVEC